MGRSVESHVYFKGVLDKMGKKKILGITGIRSDYDLMSRLYRRLSEDLMIDFRLLVGGAHLSKTYGYSISNIHADGLEILTSVESLIDSDTLSSRLKTASIFLQNVIDIVANWGPDLIIYAGDREEVWIGALLGTYLEIPTVHFYGGDHTVTGHVDNPVRHAVTKLSTFHFVAIEEHRKRIKAMGEDPRRIFVVGNLSLDNFVDTQSYSIQELRDNIGLPVNFEKYALVIFHPDPSEKDSAGTIFKNIIKSIKNVGIKMCIGYPNTDPANHTIIDCMNEMRSDSDLFYYRNLGRREFISLYKNSSVIVGNSSSGILEAASVPLPAINVGLRQRGRLAGKNVVFCDSDSQSIDNAVKEVFCEEFQKQLLTVTNPYGDGKSALRAHELLCSINPHEFRLKTEDPIEL